MLTIAAITVEGVVLIALGVAVGVAIGTALKQHYLRRRTARRSER